MRADELQDLISQVVPGGVLDYNTGYWFGVKTGEHWFAVDKKQRTVGGLYFGAFFSKSRLRKEIANRWQEVLAAITPRKGA